MCDYLRLDEKCYRLPVLSRSIKRAFDPAKCCHDYVQFSAVDSEAAEMMGKGNHDHELENAKRAAVLPYAVHARRIKALIYAVEQPPKRRKNMLLTMRKALLSGALEDLYLSEGCFSDQTMISTDLMAVFNKPQIRLHSLFLHLVEHSLDRRPAGCWGALREIKTIKQLVVDMKENRSLDASIVAYLPDSLQDLIIVSAMDPKSKYEVWYQSLEHDTVLPLLSRFSLRESIESPPRVPVSDFAVVLADTIMKKTGKPRPINSWLSYELDALGEMMQFPIMEIACLCVERVAAAELLQHPAFLFPDLRRIQVYAGDTPTDSSALVLFAANRPIEQFGHVCMTKKPHGPLSDAMVKAIASMHKLKFLNLRNAETPLFKKSVDLEKLLPANSWPELEYISLTTRNPSEHLLRTIFAAMPAIRHAVIRVDCPTITNATVLAMLLSFCPHLTRIVIQSRGTQTPTESMKSAREAFSRYPITANSAQKLVGLSMPNFRASGAVFHFVLQKLSGAPRLEIASLTPAAVSPPELCVTRSLKHLRSLEQLAAHKVARLPAIKRFIGTSNTHGDLVRDTFELTYYNDERTQRYASTFDEIAIEMYGADQQFSVIKHTDEGSLLEALFEMLSTKEKKQLTDWDAGNYGVI